MAEVGTKSTASETKVETTSSNINRKMLRKKTTQKIKIKQMIRCLRGQIGRTRSTIKDNMMERKRKSHMKHKKILNTIKKDNQIGQGIWCTGLENAVITIMSMVQEVEEAEAAVVKVEVAEEGSGETTEEISAMIVIEKMKMINMMVNIEMMDQENIIRKNKNTTNLKSLRQPRETTTRSCTSLLPMEQSKGNIALKWMIIVSNLRSQRETIEKLLMAKDKITDTKIGDVVVVEEVILRNNINTEIKTTKESKKNLHLT